MSKITPNDVELLIGLFDASHWRELHLEASDFELHLSKDPGDRRVQFKAERSAPSPTLPPPQPSPAVAGEGAKTNAAAAEVPDHWLAIRAPNLGTFYRAPKPGAPPYVEIGQAVTADSEVCLIEVMKLFTTVCAGLAGTVRRVCAADAEMIEHDQILFYVEP